MKYLLKLLPLSIFVFIAACNSVLGLNDYKVVIDTDPAGTIDYWIDGYCPGSSTKASDDCKNIPFEGCCNEKGSLLYCNNTAKNSDERGLYCLECAKNSKNNSCSWNSDTKYYSCTSEYFGEDPSGDHPIGCQQNDHDTDSDSDTGSDSDTLLDTPAVAKFCNTLTKLTGIGGNTMDMKLIIDNGKGDNLEIVASPEECSPKTCKPIPMGDNVTVTLKRAGGSLGDQTLDGPVEMSIVNGQQWVFWTNQDSAGNNGITLTSFQGNAQNTDDNFNCNTFSPPSP